MIASALIAAVKVNKGVQVGPIKSKPLPNCH